MTTFGRETKKCGVCKAKDSYSVMMSTSSFGGGATDGRPAPPHGMYVPGERCKSCGYCAVDITEATPRAKEYVRSAEYQACLKDRRYPEFANELLCISALAIADGEDYAAAGQAALWAAWASDTADQEEVAVEMRVRAAVLLEKARARGQRSRRDGSEALILIDVWRRAKNFDAARRLAEEAFAANPTGQAKLILESQLKWIARSDDHLHLVDEAVDRRTPEQLAEEAIALARRVFEEGRHMFHGPESEWSWMRGMFIFRHPMRPDQLEAYHGPAVGEVHYTRGAARAVLKAPAGTVSCGTVLQCFVRPPPGVPFHHWTAACLGRDAVDLPPPKPNEPCWIEAGLVEVVELIAGGAEVVIVSPDLGSDRVLGPFRAHRIE